MTKEDAVHIHNGILLSHKKNEMMPYVATWMDLQMIREVKFFNLDSLGFLLLRCVGSHIFYDLQILSLIW